MELLLKLQFDTIYHEHFSYLSLHVVKKLFDSCDLKIFDVERIGTHGGSLRIYGCHHVLDQAISPSVHEILELEVKNGLLNLNAYVNFKNKVRYIKFNLIEYLIFNKKNGKKFADLGLQQKE